MFLSTTFTKSRTLVLVEELDIKYKYIDHEQLVEELDTRYKDIKIKQHKHVNHLGCVLDETVSGKTIALRVTEKINPKLKFLYEKIGF